ncbi:MAG: NADP-dependent isocitrate dehydrogenase [Planctomycetota bacterium]|nr:NADP-dependent isocitrate dehydrogenase [Planctomycetota bacterium]
MSVSASTIIYTQTDEAPALATHSLLPIIRAFTQSSGVVMEKKDISLAGRILANFPDYLNEDQKQNDALSELGELAKTPDANIIKLPNISASIPQLTSAIKELQDRGYAVPDFPEEPQSDEQHALRERYTKVLGSAVNPVLREGNSDRRVAAPVKAYAQKNPHSMGDWSSESKSHVAHMDEGDFFGSEQSHVMSDPGCVRIELLGQDGNVTVLREAVELQSGELIDAAVMSQCALRSFLTREIEDARDQGVLLSLHLKATMMKVSDPILFGHAVSVYYRQVFDKHAEVLDQLGVDPRNGLGDLYAKISKLPDDERAVIDSDIESVYREGPLPAMVDSDRGITNFHVPSDIIIDASMPAAIRSSGQMWGPDGKLCDTKYIIPDRCYAGVYDETIRFCIEHGTFDVTTMGNVSNVGLMAQKAEEYGSHDKTFEIPTAGTVRVIDQSGEALLEHSVEVGDIWRMCQTKDAAIRDWVKLAVTRARATGAPAVFWLNEKRSHDTCLITKMKQYLADHDTDGLEITVLSPVEATRLTCQRAREGKDTISVTGNVLRDYLTDLFPILELGTSAKMLSIVPLLAGGKLFETGAGGSAPKHVQQFVKECHLRWDSLGEFLALAVSLEECAVKTGNKQIQLLADTLNQATGLVLDNKKSPSRKVHELDNRGSHFYLALYWAQALAQQEEYQGLREQFGPLSEQLEEKEAAIIEELTAVQGPPMDIGGYFYPDEEKAAAAMRPSPTFNAILDSFLVTE